MLKKTPILLILTAILFQGCQKSTMITERYEDGSYVKYEVDKKDSLRNGIYELFDAENRIMERSHFVQNDLNGLRTLYDTLGQVSVEEYYKNGRFDGSYLSYYSDGKKEMEGQYVGNEMSGKWNRYYNNGQLMESVTFESNEENGPFIEYYENGHLKAEGGYLNGDHEDGELKLYNEEGILERKMNCVAGRCSTIWKLNDEIQ